MMKHVLILLKEAACCRVHCLSVTTWSEQYDGITVIKIWDWAEWIDRSYSNRRLWCWCDKESWKADATAMQMKRDGRIINRRGVVLGRPDGRLLFFSHPFHKPSCKNQQPQSNERNPMALHSAGAADRIDSPSTRLLMWVILSQFRHNEGSFGAVLEQVESFLDIIQWHWEFSPSLAISVEATTSFRANWEQL